MSLKLSKTNTPAYDYLSEGTGLNPAICSVTIDKLGGTKTSSATNLFLIATKAGNDQIGSYSGISVTPTTPQTGITWEISLNGSTWLSSIAPSDADCSSVDVVIPVYVRIVADNASTSPLNTGNYAGKFAISATENPPV